jgi:hypothetical protein
MSATVIRKDPEFRSSIAPPITPAEDALAAAKLVERQARATALLMKGNTPATVAHATGLPMRDVLRLVMEVREAKRQRARS